VPRGAGALHPLGLNPGFWTIRETKPRSHLTSALQMPPSSPLPPPPPPRPYSSLPRTERPSGLAGTGRRTGKGRGECRLEPRLLF
jgi:hypothetical protein